MKSSNMDGKSKKKKAKRKSKMKKVENSNADLIKLPPIEKESSNENETKEKNEIKKEPHNEENNTDINNNKKDKVILDFSKCLFFSNYQVTKKISEGNYSKVYQLTDNETGDLFACKIEPKKAEQPMLEYEYKIMDYLRGSYIPSIKLYGSSGDYNILIMQLLGKSLNYYIKKTEIFSIHTTAMLAFQIINILQYIHLRGIIHRDIKPGNFVMGLGEKNLDLYIIDFGFAKKYKSMTTNKIYNMTEKHDLTGTSRYASINAMKGFSQSPRDDLESLGYMLYFFLKGKLPWMGIKEKNKENLDKKILKKKLDTVDEILGKDLPIQFCDFLTYAKNLKYDETPDYNLFKDKMMEVIRLGNEKFDKIYDWTDKNKLKKEEEPVIEKVESTCCKM